MRFGRLVIRSDKVGSQTVLSQIVQMVAQAQRCFRARIGANDFADEQVLRLAASLDHGSEHPLVAALVEAGRARGLALVNAEDVEPNTGIGMRGG